MDRNQQLNVDRYIAEIGVWYVRYDWRVLRGLKSWA